MSTGGKPTRLYNSVHCLPRWKLHRLSLQLPHVPKPVLSQYYSLPAVRGQRLRVLDMCYLWSFCLPTWRQWWMHTYSFFAAYAYFNVEWANLAYLQQVAVNYGDLRFQSISVQNALNDPHFRIVNNFMLNGQYKHFISLTTQPIQSVGTF